MKKMLLAFFIAIATAVFVSGCGGGGSSSSSGNNNTGDTSNDDTSNEETATTVAGTASKGILVGATVTVYPLLDGLVDENSPLGSATTGAAGDYSIELSSDYDGGPVVVRITPAADNSTVMKCDLAAGCGGVAFGGDYPLTDASFSLQSILSEVEEGEVSVNITPLTDIAAALALNAIMTSSSTPTAETVAAAIEIAKSQVADRFGVSGDLNEVPVVDITSPEALKAASADAVRYNSLNAAIVEAVNADEPTALSVEAAIASFTADFLASGLSDRTARADVTSLEEILGAAQEVLAAAEGLDATLDLSDVTRVLVTDAGTAAQGSLDEPTQGTPSGTAAASRLAKVKGFVQQLRNLQTGVTLADLIENGRVESTGAAVEAGIDLTAASERAQAFQAQLEAVQAFDTDAGDLLRAVGLVLSAMGEASTAWKAEQTLTSFTSDNGLTIAISSGADGLALMFDDTVVLDDEAGTEVEVALTGVDNTDIQETEEGEEFPDPVDPSTSPSDSGNYRFSAGGNLDITLEGAAESDLLRLTIAPGSKASITAFETTQTEDWEYGLVEEPPSFTYAREGTDSVTITEMVLNLDVTLEELDEEPITFTGALGASLDNLNYNGSFSVGSSSGFAESGTLSFGELSFTLSGEFANPGQDTFSAVLTIDADGNGITLTDSDESGNGETADNYVDFGFSLSFTVTLAGVIDTDVVVVSISGGRTGLETGEITLSIAYPGVQIEVVATRDSSAGTLTITNQDGVTTVITQPEADELSGTISLDGTVYATIEEGDAGILIRYTDDSFESL